MQYLILFFPFVLTILLVIINVDAYNNWLGINGFTLWNCVPLLLAALVLVQGVKAQMHHPNRRFRALWSVIGFASGILGTALFVLVAWRLNWWEVRTSSSTSGLIFVFLPFLELGLGLVGFGVGALVAKLTHNHTSLLGERSQKAINLYVLACLTAISALVFAGLSAYTASQV